MTYSARAIQKLGIRDPLWRKGDPLEDFINEQLLVDEAVRARVPLDHNRLRESAERAGLTAGETDYLRRLMMIGSLIDMNNKDAGSELIVEILSVDYKTGDASAKTELSTDLQEAARTGKPFEEIQKTYRDSVTFSRMGVQEFSARHKDKSAVIKKLNFLSEETVVMWSQTGYMLIRPRTSRVAFNPLAEPGQGERTKIETVVNRLIENLRKN
jgi:hypothetical protein